MSALKKLKFWICLALLLISQTLAYTQLHFASLENVWQYADQHAVQIRLARAGKITSGISVQQSYGALLPTVQANGGFTDNVNIQPTLIPASLFNPAAPSNSYSEASFGKRYLYNGSLSVQWNLLNLQDWFSIKAARLNDEIEALNIIKTKRTVYEQLASAWYSCQLLVEAEKLFRENLSSANSIYEIATQKLREGVINTLTINTAAINRERAAKNLEEALNNKAVQLNNLKLMLGITDTITIGDQMKALLIIDTALTGADPETAIAQKKMLLAEQQLKIAKSSFAPTLSAIYQYNTQIAADDFLKFNNSNTLPQQLWGLRLSVPIFSGNLKKNQLKKAENDFASSNVVYQQVKKESRIENENLKLSMQQSQLSLQRTEKMLALYKNNDEHAHQRLEEGIISLDERLKYYTDMNQGEQEYLQQLSDLFIQQYRIKIRQITSIQ